LRHAAGSRASAHLACGQPARRGPALLEIIILGAGRVGESVAESLVSEQNDITVIDPDPERLRDLEERLDLRGVGNGASLRCCAAPARRMPTC
jgi:glutamyl-tRNA reductase